MSHLVQVTAPPTTSPELRHLTHVINDALRLVTQAINEAAPGGAVILWPEDGALPLGWQVADGTHDTPDLVSHGMAGHVYIVRRH